MSSDDNNRNTRTTNPHEGESLPTPSSGLRRSHRVQLSQADNVRYDTKYHPMDDIIRPSQAKSRKRAHGVIVLDNDDDVISIHSEHSLTVGDVSNSEDRDSSGDTGDTYRKTTVKPSPRKGIRASNRIAKQDTPPSYSQAIHPQDNELRYAGVIRTGRYNSINRELSHSSGKSSSRRHSSYASSSGNPRKNKKAKVERGGHGTLAKTVDISIDECRAVYEDAWVSYAAYDVTQKLRNSLNGPLSTISPQALDRTSEDLVMTKARTKHVKMKVRPNLSNPKGIPIDEFIASYEEAWESLGKMTFERRIKEIEKEYPVEWELFLQQHHLSASQDNDESELQNTEITMTSTLNDTSGTGDDNDLAEGATSPMQHRQSVTSVERRTDKDSGAAPDFDSIAQSSAYIPLFSAITSSIFGRKRRYSSSRSLSANFIIYEDTHDTITEPLVDVSCNIRNPDFDKENDPESLLADEQHDESNHRHPTIRPTIPSMNFVGILTAGAFERNAHNQVLSPESIDFDALSAANDIPHSGQGSLCRVIAPAVEVPNDTPMGGSQNGSSQQSDQEQVRAETQPENRSRARSFKPPQTRPSFKRDIASKKTIAEKWSSVDPRHVSGSPSDSEDEDDSACRLNSPEL